MARTLLLGWYNLASLFPVQNRILCLSRQSNNPPLDFVLLKEVIESDHPDYSVVILPKAIGNKLAYIAHMLKQVAFIATSRAVVLDSYCLTVSLLSPHISIPVVQMWHALGLMKQAGYAALEDEQGRSAETAELLRMHRGYTSVLVSSNTFREDFARTFDVDPSIVIEAALPRVDLLTDPAIRQRRRDAITSEFPSLANGETVVYCPTFRSMPTTRDQIAVCNLATAIINAGYNFVYKPHPVSKLKIDDPRIVQDRSGRVDMLFAADYVITDYSTVMYEAGLMEIPVFLYGYDWNDYRQKRSFGIDIPNDVPATMSDDPDRIVEAIRNKEFDPDAFKAFVNHFVRLPQGESCTKHIESHLFELIERREQS